MNQWFRWGCALAGLAVLLGAFAAHGLRDRLTPDMLAVFETGVRYQMYHSLALLVLGLVPVSRRAQVDLGGWAFVLGILLFSGSLYLLAVTGMRTLGFITPFGGLAFLVGWFGLVARFRTEGNLTSQ